MPVSKIITLIDFTALTLQIVATLIMFSNSPINKPFGAFVGASNPDYETPRRKQIWLKRGLGILCLGFFFQLISLIMRFQ